MKCLDNVLPMFILILSGFWVFLAFKSFPAQNCMVEQREVAYTLKVIPVMYFSNALRQ